MDFLHDTHQWYRILAIILGNPLYSVHDGDNPNTYIRNWDNQWDFDKCDNQGDHWQSNQSDNRTIMGIRRSLLAPGFNHDHRFNLWCFSQSVHHLDRAKEQTFTIDAEYHRSEPDGWWSPVLVGQSTFHHWLSSPAQSALGFRAIYVQVCPQ